MYDDDRDSALSAALRKVGEEDLADAADPRVEAHLLAEVRAIGRARRRRAQTMVFALAAAVVLASGAALWRSGPAPAPEVAPPARAEIVTPFYPLIHSAVPLTGGQVVRMEVSRQALVMFGLAAPERPGVSPGTVLADVIVGQDGLARAVRFVQPAAEQEN